MMIRLFFTFIFLLLNFETQPCIELQFRYIGNMGILISGESSSVLIDGMHTEYNKDSYLFPPQELVDRLTANNSKEYAPIKAIMATHNHGDHLDGGQIATFLKKNTDAIFLGSNQSSQEVLKADKTIQSQIQTIDTRSYTKQTITKDDLSITGFYMNHAGGDRRSDIQNVGFIVEINNKKILHMGDTDWYPDMFNELNLVEEEIDIAVFPFWMLLAENAQQNVEKWINPNRIVATHLPPKNFERYTVQLKQAFPKILSFTELESVEFFGE